MIDTNKLRGIIAEKGMSQAEMASILGITPKTFYQKMNKRVFDSDEIDVMISTLEIPHDKCVDIFFAQLVT